MRLHTNKFCGAVALWLLLLSFCQSHAQGTFQWTVSFDGAPILQPTDSPAITNYYEEGMTFRPIGQNDRLGRSGGGEQGFAYNGSAYIYAAFGDSLAVSSLSGAPFGLVSVDLAEFSILYQSPLTVQFVGYRPDGSIATTEFVTDGIIDSTGPLADFQTFYFDSRFADLVRVEVPTYRWSLDNMVFSTIPEPSTFVLMIFGATLAIIRLFKRKT